MSNRRSALGRGLGALISNPGPSTATQHDVSLGSAQTRLASSGVQQLPVDQIDPNPEQPRRHFDTDQLEQLADSILRHGVLQPVVVRRAGSRYELIVGERRWRASRAAGLETIPVVMADATARERLELAIVENVQRHDLNPMELAHAYKALAEGGATHEEIGKRVSMDRSSVSNHLRLLELPRSIQEDVEFARLTMGHAKALLQVTNPERRQRLRDRAVSEGLTVRATESAARQLGSQPQPSQPPPAHAQIDPDRQRLIEDLQRRLQARVQLTGAARGRIEIQYSSSEDLQRITSLLLGVA